jgi:hypothetical protein
MSTVGAGVVRIFISRASSIMPPLVVLLPVPSCPRWWCCCQFHHAPAGGAAASYIMPPLVAAIDQSLTLVPVADDGTSR